jgi:hypothetical protein
MLVMKDVNITVAGAASHHNKLTHLSEPISWQCSAADLWRVKFDISLSAFWLGLGTKGGIARLRASVALGPTIVTQCSAE